MSLGDSLTGSGRLIRVEMSKWGQSLEDLRRLTLQALHPRTRERFLALSQIADGTDNATTWAARFRRRDETVMKWVHTYNSHGPDALTYRRTGGPAPLLRPLKPKPSSMSSATPNRSTTDCPVTAGP